MTQRPPSLSDFEESGTVTVCDDCGLVRKCLFFSRVTSVNAIKVAEGSDYAAEIVTSRRCHPCHQRRLENGGNGRR